MSQRDPLDDPLVQQLGLEPGEAFACPYLPGRSARDVGFISAELPSGFYQFLMDRRFRRSGMYVYQPACSECSACQPLRVPVAEFRPTRSQRRCLRNNGDIQVRVGYPRPETWKYELYRRYLDARHNGGLYEESYESFVGFLYTSPVTTVEVQYVCGGRTIAIGIADVETSCLSAVYLYFDPEFSFRSPGLFNLLWLVDYCRTQGLPYLYLGYYIRGSAKMSYKAALRPNEVLVNLNWLPAQKK